VAGAFAYRAGALAVASVRYADGKSGIDRTQRLTLLAPLDDEGPRWAEAWVYAGQEPTLSATPAAGAPFAALPTLAARPPSWKRWEKQALAHLAAERPLTVLSAPGLGLSGQPGEGRDAFLAKVALRARERRDEEVAKLSAKWEPRIRRAQEKVEKLRRKIEDASADRTTHMAASGLEIGATVLAMFGGRRSALRSAASVATKARRAQKSGEQQARAEEDRRLAEADLAAMESDLKAALDELRASWDPARVPVEERRILPKKADVLLDRLVLTWVPVAG
jgi:hypothetical protein